MFMKKSIELRWIGDTSPKGRPRFSRQGRRVITFTDAKTRSAEKVLKDWFGLMCKLKGFSPLDVPCGMELIIIRPMPKSPKFKEWPGVRPDADNLGKLVMDSANEILWADDCLVCKMNIEKIYPGPLNLEPGFMLRVYEL